MHHLHHKKENDLIIKFDTNQLTPTQARLIKTVNALMAHIVSADEEAELFEGSAEMLIKMSELIHHSQFAQTHKELNYAEQALEYSIDFLRENLDSLLHTNLDN
ncbi:MAG: hypothetical protein WDA09_09800 [Bacteriovoracaceae bacterium]